MLRAGYPTLLIWRADRGLGRGRRYATDRSKGDGLGMILSLCGFVVCITGHEMFSLALLFVIVF